MGMRISREEDQERKQLAVDALRTASRTTDLPGHLVSHMHDDRPRLHSGASAVSVRSIVEQRLQQLGERGLLS